MAANDICNIHGCVKRAHSLGLCAMHYTRLRRNGDANLSQRNVGDPHVFAHKAAKAETDECIEWPYCKLNSGYGQVRVNGKTMNAHRYVLSLVSSPPGEGYVAAHMPIVCHNRLCVNPRHLRWATSAENVKDMEVDGTKPLGQKTKKAKLTPHQVLSIRSDDRKESILANEYGVSKATIGRIKRREDWKWL